MGKYQNMYVNYFCLCVKRKKLCNCLRHFLPIFHHFLPRKRVTRIGFINMKRRVL